MTSARRGYDATLSTGPASPHIRDLLMESDKDDGGGTLVAKTILGYDEGTASTAANASGYTTPGYIQLGNLTSVKRWLDQTLAYLTTTYTNDVLGNPLTITDPRSNKTTFDYTDSCDIGNFGSNKGLRSRRKSRMRYPMSATSITIAEAVSKCCLSTRIP